MMGQDSQAMTRMVMAGLGGLAGLVLYGLSEFAPALNLSDRAQLLAAAGMGSFFVALLAMVGPLRPAQAATGALVVAVAVTLCLAIAATGFADARDLFEAPQAVLSGLILTLVPLPFWIAAQGAGWRDYPTLFGESWGIVVRYGAAWAFVGLVWAVILLSDALLQIVGIALIDSLIDLGPMRWLISGGALGLGLAVVQEFSEYVSPYLILRMLRLLVPVVLLVTAVFLVALSVQGVSGVLGKVSFALTLLAMAGAAATLVTAAVDQEDSQAVQGGVMARLTQAMALLILALAGLGAWAVWQRVVQYGWTPERVFAAEVAAMGLGYGVLYAVAVLQGTGWMARVRQANVVMAMVLLGLAVLSLSPVLSAERIAAASLMARLTDGRMPVTELDPHLLASWGKPGAKALATLETRAQGPGQQALARQLTLSDLQIGEQRRAELLAELTLIMPLQPVTATATRDMYLQVLETATIAGLRDDCKRQFASGGAGCVMVVADLKPALPGEEAVIVDYSQSGYVQFIGFQNDPQAGPMVASVLPTTGALPMYEGGEALIRAWQAAPPAAQPLVLNQITFPEGGIFLAP